METAGCSGTWGLNQTPLGEATRLEYLFCWCSKVGAH